MSWRDYRYQQLKADYFLLVYIFVSFSIFAILTISINILSRRSQAVAEQFADFAVINLPPPSPVINPQLENVTPPEVDDMEYKPEDLLPLPEESAIAEGAIGDEGAMPEDLMMEQKIETSETEKAVEDVIKPAEPEIPKRAKVDSPMKNMLPRTAQKVPPGGKANKGLGAPEGQGTGQKSFGRGEFGLGEGGGAMLGSKTGFGRGGAGASPFGSKFGSGKGTKAVDGTGRKSKKSIRIILAAYVLADGKVDTVEYMGAVGVEELEAPELKSIIDLAVNEIRAKQYEPSNEPLRKITEEVDFSYMGKDDSGDQDFEADNY